ncbi:hypothetical protein HK105_206736 [Polyrhizophydium stewartii]|uniref:Cilia- and flagella-associated protein 53 n=1 Tax=Polyrhizophydium stewartii TaxID=2732419 RepID=A0ABR4N2I9_9FUNG
MPRGGGAPQHKSDYLITNRRREEDLRNVNLETTQYYARTDMKSRFEESTNMAIFRQQIQRRFSELKANEASKLDERRGRLRQLLKDDEERYRALLLAKEETRETRVEAMRQRMHDLREQRERERQAIVTEKLAQRWRKECDQLRAIESKVREKHVSEARAEQIREQGERREAERREKRYYDDLWEQDRLKKIEREERDREHLRAMNRSTIEMLEKQLTALKLQAQREVELKQEEARLMKEEHETRLLEDQRKQQQKHMEQVQIRQDLDEFNKMKLQQRQREVQAALEMDMRILAEFLKMDRVEREGRQRRREEMRREMQMYREHLLAQKEIEKQREAEIEQWFVAEQERLWKARSEKWRKEQAARDRLMKEVMEGRQEQLKVALERNRQAQERVRIEKLEIEKRIEEAKQWEAAQHEKAAKTKREYSTMLKEQMEIAERRAAEERRRIELEDAAAKAANEEYEAMLSRELARVLQS